jgi:hypothetical protein
MDALDSSYGIFPLEIVEHLMFFLDGHVLVNALQTCKAWYSLAKNEKIWETVWNNYFLSHTLQFQYLVRRVFAYDKFVHSNTQNSKYIKLSAIEYQEIPLISHRERFILASNIIYVAKDPKVAIFHDPSQFWHERPRLFTSIEAAIPNCVVNGYLVILGLNVSSDDEFVNSSLMITKPVNILSFGKLIDPRFVWRTPPNTRGEFFGLQANCKHPICVESGTLTLRESTICGTMYVASGAIVSLINSKLECFDKNELENESTALLKVEGQATISDSQVLSCGAYAIEITSTGDVAMSNCTVSAKKECIKLVDGGCLDMKATLPMQGLLISQQGIDILTNYVNADTNLKRIASACRSLGNIGFHYNDIAFCKEYLSVLLKCLLAHMNQPLVINGAVHGIELLSVRCIDFQQDVNFEFDELPSPPSTPLDFLIEPLLNAAKCSLADASTIRSIFSTLRHLLIFYGKPYLQKMMELDCWTLVASTIKEHTREGSTDQNQKALISISQFIEASHQLLKVSRQSNVAVKSNINDKINIVTKLVKEGAIECLCKYLNRVVEKIHTVEEYFDDVYPIVTSLQSLHGTPEFLSCLGKNNIVSLCLKLIGSPMFDPSPTDNISPELSEATAQLFRLLQRTMKNYYYEFIDCNGIKIVMNYIKKSVRILPLATFYAFEVLRSFVDLGNERDRNPFIAVQSEGIIDFMLDLLNTYRDTSFLPTSVAAIVENLAKEKEAAEVLAKGLFDKLYQCFLMQEDDQFLASYVAGIFRSLLLNENLNQNEIDQKFLQLDIYSLLVRLMNSRLDDTSYFYEVSLILHWLGYKGRLERYIGPQELKTIFQYVFVRATASFYVIGKLFTALARVEKFCPPILEQLRTTADEISQPSTDKQLHFKRRLAIYHVIHHLSYVAEGGRRQFFVEGGILKVLLQVLKCEEPSKFQFPASIVIDTLGHFAEDEETRERHGDILKTLCALAVEYSRVTEWLPSQKKLFDMWLPWTTNRLCGIQLLPPPENQPVLVAATNNIKISTDGLQCFNLSIFFESIRANYGVKQGKIYVEVELLTSELFQLGWLTAKCKLRPHDNYGYGVGDDFDSWAVDFYRGLVWHKKPSPYGEAKSWKEGDIVQMYLDLDKGEISWGLNGTHFGIAFKDLPLGEIFFAGGSLSTEQACRWNFGNQPFKFALPEGYKPYYACLSANCSDELRASLV